MTLPQIQIDKTLCVRCGACVRDCLAKIIHPNGDGFPVMNTEMAVRCFRCQHCLAVCPTGALQWTDKTANQSVSSGQLPSPESMLNLLRARRSIRDYRPENVDPTIIDALHSAMAFVPTGCNDHRLFFSYSDKKTTDSFRLAAAQDILEFIDLGTLPASIAHFTRLKEPLEKGTDIFFRSAPHFVAIAVPPDAKDAHIDPFIAATQFELLANAYGLGTCWGGMATDLLLADPKLYGRLNIPTGYELKIVLLFGYPAIQYARLPQPEPCRRTQTT